MPRVKIRGDLFLFTRVSTISAGLIPPDVEAPPNCGILCLFLRPEVVVVDSLILLDAGSGVLVGRVVTGDDTDGVLSGWRFSSTVVTVATEIIKPVIFNTK